MMTRVLFLRLLQLLFVGAYRVTSFAPPLLVVPPRVIVGRRTTAYRHHRRNAVHRNADASGVVVTTAEQPSCKSSSLTGEVQNDNSDMPPLWDELVSRFQGDFDNYRQVVEDRAAGLLPREQGGHEHIHCTLVPVATNARLAAFYFDGDPTAIFRFRYYQLVPHGDTVDTILYTIDPSLEGLLRQCPDPLQWKQIFTTENGKDRVTLLPDCDVQWSWQLDPIQHAYAVSHHQAKSDEDDQGMHAVMVHGEALVESQVMPGVKILIRDQLSLWNDELWIHDRGFEPNTMQFIYGNQRGVPYRLERVSNMVMMGPTEQEENDHDHDDDNVHSHRQVVDETLAWTLGREHRTEQEYQAKLDKVGGPSRPQRRPKS